MARHVYVKESALAQFSEKCGATPAARSLISSQLRALGKDPETSGYKIPFVIPSFWQMEIDKFRVHYVFDETEVTVLYVGIPGVC